MFGSISFISLVVFFHQGIMGDDVRPVVGYMNESLVLHSDNPSWTLSQIHWSVYENVTYVAIVQGKIKSVDLQPLFQGRLELDGYTGDLTITKVLSSDALRYRVDLVGTELNQRKTSYVHLSVKEQLGKPSMQLRHRYLDLKYCVISLSCSTKNISNISLSWQPEPGFNESMWSGPRGNSGESVLWTSFTPNRAVTFFCIAANDGQRKSSNMSVTCTGSPQIRTKERVIGGLIGGLIGGSIVCILLLCFQHYKGTKNGETKEVELLRSRNFRHQSALAFAVNQEDILNKITI